VDGHERRHLVYAPEGAGPFPVLIALHRGGIMSHFLACGSFSERLAAIAPVIGSAARGLLETCAPAHPMPVFWINGTEDEFVPLDGGKIHNECSPAFVQTEEKDDVADDDSALVMDTWSSCADDVELRRVLVVGGGHTWPGQGELTEFAVGNVSQEIDGADHVWDWLSRFSLP
jgi:polyhydroxybutyrate depolymerase